MVEFDPGPPPEVAEHFARVPSSAPHRELFWYDWRPVFYRGRLEGPPAYCASPRIPGRPSGSRAVRSSGTPANVSKASSLPFGLPNRLGDDSRGHQSRPKRRNTVERDAADLLHTLIWRAPAG
jgi:hypothetical protein